MPVFLRELLVTLLAPGGIVLGPAYIAYNRIPRFRRFVDKHLLRHLKALIKKGGPQ